MVNKRNCFECGNFDKENTNCPVIDHEIYNGVAGYCHAERCIYFRKPNQPKTKAHIELEFINAQDYPKNKLWLFILIIGLVSLFLLFVYFGLR